MHRALALAVLALVTLVACVPGPTSTPSSAASQLATGAATAGASPGAPVVIPRQMDTAWGRVWDGVPPSFPRIPGAEPMDTPGDPVSATFDLPAEAGAVADVARTYADALGAAGWIVTVDGPLEDGSFVVDAVRAGTSCAARIQVTPLEAVGLLTVLYGADCPFA